MTKCEANKMWCDFDLDSETTHETNRQNRQVTLHAEEMVNVVLDTVKVQQTKGAAGGLP